jgi:hypothetical protein
MKKIYDYNSCREALVCIPYRMQVLLAHEWVLSVLPIFEKEFPNDLCLCNCLDLLFKWIVDPNSVAEQELKNTVNTTYAKAYAANAAYYASNAAYYAAYYAANASAYAVAAYYASNASNASNAAYYAANAAYYAVAANTINWQFIEDTFNHCYCSDLTFDDNWKTSTVVGLTKTIFNNNSLDLCTILADALEDAGCTETKILDRLRNSTILRSEWIIWNLFGLDHERNY